MAAKRKTWREKLADSKDLPKVVPISGKMTRRWGRGTVVVPAPSEVDVVMKRVPRGKLITINEIRAALARKHSATIGCPITTGIFAWIAAHAAEEAAAEGAKRITPYWRTLKTGGELNAKYPGGIEQLKKRLAAEGHRIVAKGKRWLVADRKTPGQVARGDGAGGQLSRNPPGHFPGSARATDVGAFCRLSLRERNVLSRSERRHCAA